MGWGGAIELFLKKIPIQDRKERIKNQIKNLEREQEELKKGECTTKKTATYQRNKSELVKLLDQLANLT